MALVRGYLIFFRLFLLLGLLGPIFLSAQTVPPLEDDAPKECSNLEKLDLTKLTSADQAKTTLVGTWILCVIKQKGVFGENHYGIQFTSDEQWSLLFQDASGKIEEHPTEPDSYGLFSIIADNGIFELNFRVPSGWLQGQMAVSTSGNTLYVGAFNQYQLYYRLK